MKASPLFVGRPLRQFDGNIYAALAGREPVVIPAEPKRAFYTTIQFWLSHSLADRFPVAKAAARRRIDEAKARVTRSAE